MTGQAFLCASRGRWVTAARPGHHHKRGAFTVGWTGSGRSGADPDGIVHKRLVQGGPSRARNTVTAVDQPPNAGSIKSQSVTRHHRGVGRHAITTRTPRPERSQPSGYDSAP